MDTKKALFVPAPDGAVKRFDVPVGQYTTVLDALEWIRTKHEPDLVYRHSCHHGSCGTCGMLINGEPALSCTARLGELESEVEVNPLPATVHSAGLAVDPTPVHKTFPGERSYLRTAEKTASARHKGTPVGEPPEEVGEFNRFEDCIECGLCIAACPVDTSFIGPAALAAYHRELEKDPDKTEAILNRVGEPDGVDACRRALRCSAVCPTGVNPAKHIAVLKRKLQSR